MDSVSVSLGSEAQPCVEVVEACGEWFVCVGLLPVFRTRS
jgi:hypothetical protein